METQKNGNIQMNLRKIAGGSVICLMIGCRYGTCFRFWNKIWYMFQVLEQDMVHVSGSGTRSEYLNG